MAVGEHEGVAMTLHTCTECGADYTSPLAAELCGDADRAEQARQRAWEHELANRGTRKP